MNIDLTPLITALAPLALAAITAGIPIVITQVQRHLKIQVTDQRVAAITQACQAAASSMYGFVVQQGATVTNIPVHNAALAHGVNHVLASVPDALKEIGITPEQVSRMVEARYGGVLATASAASVADQPSGTNTSTSTNTSTLIIADQTKP